MARNFLWATLVIASAIVLAGGRQSATAQNSDERREAASSDASTDSPHQTPANTTNSDQERSILTPANQYGEQGRADNRGRSNDNRSWRDRQQDSDRNEQASERGDRSREAQDRRQASDDRNRTEERSELRRSGQGGRDWKSDIRFGRATQDGLKIESLEQGTPFYRSGLRDGDVIVSYGGRPIRSEDDFGRWVVYRPGERVPVIVLRDGGRETIYVTYEPRGNRMNSNNEEYSEQGYGGQAYLGLRFEQRGRGAAVISSVMSGGPAAEAGLQSGDEILAIDGQDVSSARDIIRIVAAKQPGDRLQIDFSRPAENHTEAVLERRPGAGSNTAYEQWQDRGREGSQYQDVETSSYNQETNGSGDYNSGRQINRAPERRGILPRFRD